MSVRRGSRRRGGAGRRRGRSVRRPRGHRPAAAPPPAYRHPLVSAMCELLGGVLPAGGVRRWAPLPLCLCAVLMAWDAAPTLGERFESARQSLRAMFPRAKLGRTYQGLAKALARTGLHKALPPRLREQTLARSGRHALREGWRAFAADGSRFDCPRTAANKKAFGRGGRRGSGPQMYLTALWHMGSGLPFAWRVGRASAGERTHLRRMVKLLPPGALLVMDAGFVGHGLLSKVVGSGRHVLLRVGSNASLLTCLGTGLGPARREGPDVVYLWPRRGPRGTPLALRLIRVAVPNKPAVWLLTDVADRRRMSDRRAARLYAMRWGVEVFFRSLKQKLQRRKVCSASPGRARVELHWAVLGLWAAGLMAVDVVVKAGRDPLSWSAAAVVRLLRGAARRGPAARALRAELAGAVKDRYHRRGGKRAHRWPHKKRDQPPGAPRLRAATPREVLLARELYDAKRAA